MTEKEIIYPSFSFIEETAEQFGAKKERTKTEYKEDAMKLVLEGAVSVPFSQLLFFDKELVEFTKIQLADMLGQLLSGETSIKIKAKEFDSLNKIPFSLEEQITILTFLRLFPEKESCKIIEDFGDSFVCSRSRAEIVKKVDEMRKLSDAEKNEIYEKMVHEIAEEELFGISTETEATDDLIRSQLSPSDFIQCRCVYSPHEDLSVDPDHLKEPLYPILENTSVLFKQELKDTDLAILRSEKYKWYMRREAILIGRGSIDFDVDVDLSTFGDKACVHISRHQAIISFLTDYNFYINNIGNRVFRVNGIPIYPGNLAKLPDNALIDFSGILMIFYPNKDLIKELKETVDLGLIKPPEEHVPHPQ